MLKSLLQESIDNYGKSRKLFVAKTQSLHFSSSIRLEFEKLPLAQTESQKYKEQSCEMSIGSLSIKIEYFSSVDLRLRFSNIMIFIFLRFMESFQFLQYC